MPDYLLHKDTGELEIVSGTEPFTVAPNAGDGIYDVYRLDNSATIAVTTEDTVAPVITNLTATLSDENQAVLAWSSDEASGTAYWVCTTSLTAPSTAQIKGGQDHTGATAEASGAQPVTVTGAQSTPPVDGLEDGTDYNFHLLQEDARSNASTILTASVSVPAVDVTAPVLSGVAAMVTGTTATLRWSSDEGNGTAYWVCTRSATVPTTTQIIAGQDNTGTPAVASGMQAVSNAGAQDDEVVTGLGAGAVYFFHLLHQDDNGNTSVVASTTGVTVAGSSGASAQINVVRRSVTQVAPEGFVFDITLEGFDTPGPAAGEVYDARLHDLYYYWDFDDSYQFTAPENLIPQFRDAGKAYGAKTSHVYRQPGIYNVSCLVIEPESGKFATANLSVTVGDPDVLFAGENTLYVDQRYTGGAAPAAAPTGALIYDNFIDALVQVQFYSGPATPKRIMMARGQTYGPFGPLSALGGSTDIPSFCIVAARGSGTRPVFDLSGGGISWNHTAGAGADKDYSWQGIDLIGSWDTRTQSGRRINAFFLQTNPPAHMLFDECSFDGFDIGLYPQASNDGTISDPYIFINDSILTNWRSCGIFGATGNFAITGSRLSQNVNALSGYGESGNELISPVRFVNCSTVIFHQNDMFSRTGWFENTPGIYTTQPCFRGNTGGLEDAYYNVSANAMEGGFPVMAFESSDGSESRTINAVIEKNMLVGTHDSGRLIQVGYGGTTIRNNIGLLPNASRYVIGAMDFTYYWLNGTNAANLNAPQKLYNNTFVNMLSDANAPAGSAAPIVVANNAAGYTNFVVDNNINHQPNQGVANDAPFDVTVVWAPRYTHYQDSDTPRDNTKGSPPDTIALYRPLDGSPALGDAINGEVAYDDFFGNVRPQYPSRGAFEAS